jgi:RNA polymerase sigma-32 factor
MGSRYPSSDFENYTRKIKDYSLLTPEEEQNLARKYKHGDIDAGKKIVTSNLRFVVKISQPYFHLGYGPLEIVQEGNMGLVKALTRFDPNLGVRFICYAIWWIKAYIKNFIHKSYQVHTGRLTHAKSLVSLDCTIASESEHEECLLDHLLYEGPDPDDFYSFKERHAYLLSLLQSDPPILSNREVFIIEKRFFSDPPATLKDIANLIGVTRERVRQIEMRSLQRIKAAIKRHNSILAEDLHIAHEYPMRRKKI